MLSWVLGNWKIGALGEDYVPMAPVTALMLILLSGGLFVSSRWPASRVARGFAFFAVASVGGFGLLIWGQRWIGHQSSVERWLAPAIYTAGGVPVGLMSPLTALTILLAALALLLELPPFGQHRLCRWMAPGWPWAPSWRAWPCS